MRTRPLLVTGLVAFASIGALALAVANGWLGPDVGRGDNFCEAARSGLVKQPANTLSNLGFVVAGMLIAWRTTHRPEGGRVLSTSLATAYACVVVLLGPASAAMHATQSTWGGELDMLSMYLVASFAASYAWVRWMRGATREFAMGFGGCLLACELAGLWPGSVPVFLHGGNVAFAALLVAAVATETALWRRHESRRTIGFGFAALGSMVVAFAIWLLSTHGLCDPQSLLQGHAVWHLLGAVAAYFLFRLYESEHVLEDAPVPTLNR
jgi:hypothetical protein